MSQGQERRAKKLYAGLTGVERARLAVQAWKRGERSPAELQYSATREQRAFVAGILSRVHLLHSVYVPALALLEAHVEALLVKVDMVRAIRLLALDLDFFVSYIAFETAEQVTESEHAQRLAAERARLAPVREFAEMLADRHEAWCADDVEVDEAGDEVVLDTAWERVRDQEERRLVKLVREGKLRGQARGARTRIETGSFFDWLGEPVPLPGAWSMELTVRPDAESEEVVQARGLRERVRQRVAQSPGQLARILLRSKDESGTWAVVAGRLLEAVAAEASFHWQELLATNLGFDDVAEKLAGEDPADPDARATFERVRDLLLAIRDLAAGLGASCELRELSDDQRAQARAVFRDALDKGL